MVRWLNATLPRGASIDSNSGAFGSLSAYQKGGWLRADLRFERNARYWVVECAQAYAAGAWWWDLYEDADPTYRRIKTFEKDGVPLLNVFEKRESARE